MCNAQLWFHDAFACIDHSIVIYRRLTIVFVKIGAFLALKAKRFLESGPVTFCVYVINHLLVANSLCHYSTLWVRMLFKKHVLACKPWQSKKKGPCRQIN